MEPKKPPVRKPAPKPSATAPPAHEFRERPRERVAISHERRATRGLWFLPYYDGRGQPSEAQRAAFKLMMRHPVVKAAVLSKVLAVAALDWSIKLGNPDSAADRYCEKLLRHTVDRLPMGMPGLAQNLLLPTLIDGYAAAEKVRTVEGDAPAFDGRIVYADVKSRPTELWEPVVDEHGNVFRIRGKGPNANREWPVSEFVYTRYLPLYDNPVGNSDFLSAYQHFWLSDTVTKLRSQHTEKKSSPHVVGKYTNKDDKGDIESALTALRSVGWTAVPEGVMIEAVNLAGQGEADYKSFLDDCDKKIALAISGAYLHLLESQAQDPRGDSKVAKSGAELMTWYLVAMLQEAVSRQMFGELTRWNCPGVSPPRLVMGGVSEDEVTKIVTNAGLIQGLGFKISQADLARRTSWQPATDPADALKPPAPPPSPFGPAGGPAPGMAFRGR